MTKLTQVVMSGIGQIVYKLYSNSYYIPSGSMASTLEPGDRVIVDRLAYRWGDIGRGDIVVFDGDASWDAGVTNGVPQADVTGNERVSGRVRAAAPTTKEDRLFDVRDDCPSSGPGAELGERVIAVAIPYDGFAEEVAVGACVVCRAISTSRGTIVAKLDDVSVHPDWRGRGVGAGMLAALRDRLRAEGISRIDSGCHRANDGARHR